MQLYGNSYPRRQHNSAGPHYGSHHGAKGNHGHEHHREPGLLSARIQNNLAGGQGGCGSAGGFAGSGNAGNFGGGNLGGCDSFGSGNNLTGGNGELGNPGGFGGGGNTLDSFAQNPGGPRGREGHRAHGKHHHHNHRAENRPGKRGHDIQASFEGRHRPQGPQGEQKPYGSRISAWS